MANRSGRSPPPCGSGAVKRRLQEGLSRLDEAWGGHRSRHLAADTSLLYCSAIATCHEVREFARAREWTLALGVLDTLPALDGAYFQLPIYRSYLMCLCGDWRGLDEVALVCPT